MRSIKRGALFCALFYALVMTSGCGEESTSGTVKEQLTTTTASAAPAPKVATPAKASAPKVVTPAPKAAPAARPTPSRKAVAPPPPAPPTGRPLMKGAPPFDYVVLGKLKKTRRAKPIKYLSPAKRGTYWARSVHVATDEKGKTSYGGVLTRVLFTENAVGDLSMIAEVKPVPNDQTRVASLTKSVYQRTKKGKFKGDFQLVAKQSGMEKSPKPLRNAQRLVTAKTRKYKDELGRYTITAKPVGLQDITVYGKTYKGALKMERSWTQRAGKEVVTGLELSWWAPGVGEVAKLGRFGDNKGPDAIWTLTLLKAFGQTNNPHTLTAHFKKWSPERVNRFNARSEKINQHLKAQAKPKAPQKTASSLIGQSARSAAAYLKRVFYLAPSGKPNINKVPWGSLGVIQVRAQFYRCPPGKGCGYGGILLFSNAKTGVIVGGLTNVEMRSGKQALARTTQNFFKLIAGPQGADRVGATVQAKLRRKKKMETVIGRGKITIGPTSNGKSWTVAIGAP